MGQIEEYSMRKIKTEEIIRNLREMCMEANYSLSGDMKKALEDFDLTDKEKNIIRGHMWPLTFIHPPKSREALLVCLADKDIAAREFVRPELRKAKRVAGTGFTRLRKVSKPEIDKAKELAEPALDKAKETVNRLRKLF